MDAKTPDPLITTARLALRPLDDADAAFMLELLNDEDFIRHIADRGVRTLDEARAYIAAGPVESYARNGFGLWRVEERGQDVAIGLCGLVRRPGLDDVDIGFAFLPAWRGRGYARESAQAVLAHAHTRLGLARVVAIVAPDNAASAAVLAAIGLRFERLIRFGETGETLRLFAWEA
ncbi:MAG: GNAT family N-acetyltransferase [Xanthomonadales bacterium]|nr:GNAT family N-acetyltransferase [Xanthomonadales bacterium]